MGEKFSFDKNIIIPKEVKTIEEVTPIIVSDDTDVEVKKGKEIKKHPTNDQLLDQIIEIINKTKKLPEGNNWDQYSLVSNNKDRFCARKTFISHFGTFNNAVNAAIERAKEKNIPLNIFIRK